MTHLRHEKLTYELRGLIFEVRKKLKTGWTEEIYHQGLIQLFGTGIYLSTPSRTSPLSIAVLRFRSSSVI